MRDRELENWLSSVREVERLEANAGWPTAPVTLRPPRNPHAVFAALATAACIVITLGWLPGIDPPLGRSDRGDPFASWGDREICLQATSPERGAVMAFLRVWDRACECMTWRVHQWDDGDVLRFAGADEQLEIPVEIANDPPVDQYLFLAVASEGEVLDVSTDAEELLACLQDTPATAHAVDGSHEMAAAVRSCMAADVTVVPQRFRSR